MGYYIVLEDAEWFVPESPELLSALKEMPTKFKAIQRGGSYNNGKEESWFSWVSDDEILDAKSVQEIYQAFLFMTREDESKPNGFWVSGYDNKNGQQDILTGYTAPFMAEGSYLEYRGEDNEQWKLIVKNGKQMVTTPKEIQWEEISPWLAEEYVTDGVYGEEGYVSAYHGFDIYQDIQPQFDAVIASARAKKEGKPA